MISSIMFHRDVFTPWALFWGLLAVVLAYGIHFAFLWLRGHQRPHIAAIAHFHYHLIIGLIVALFVGVFVGVTIYRGLGLKFQSHRHIKPNAALVRAGGAAPFAYSLEQYLPPVVLNQGNTNACVAFSTTEARYVADRIRGETPPDVFSGFFTYWWVTGGANVGTTFDDEAASVQNHGTTLWGNQTYFGAPSQAAINAAVERGGSFRYLFYNFGGQSSVDTIKAEISTGHPVVLLIAVHDDFQNAFNGNTYTNNYGNLIDYHAVLAYAYTGNNIYIRNSWGSSFGDNGNIMLTSTAVFNTVVGAVVIGTSPSVAYNPPPLPVPTITPRPAPRPTVRPTPRPVVHRGHLVVLRATHFRLQPRLYARQDKYLLKKGYTLIYLGRQTAKWDFAETLTKKHKGWILRANVRKVR